MRSDFVAVILSHGRPGKIPTLRMLERAGYTGPIIILIDDQDESGGEYKQLYGDMVHVFSKDEIAKTFDQGDNFESKRSTSYARNAMPGIVKQLGYRWFIQLDDDYTCFRYAFDSNGVYDHRTPPIKQLDKVFEAMIRFVDDTSSVTLCAAQGGDFIGGSDSPQAAKPKLMRKAMNTFVCDAERPFTCIGKLNEDVNTYVVNGQRGDLYLTTNWVRINQLSTQSGAGGMTDAYLASGTYVKSFYTVMYAPSVTKIKTIGHGATRRIHHAISWRHAVPKIIHESLQR